MERMQIGRFRLDEIYCGDCIELMKEMPDGVVDLVIADPPFGIGFEKIGCEYNRNNELVVKGYREVPKEEYYEFSLRWIREVYRVLKREGSAYIFSGWSNLKDVLMAIDDVGFITMNHIIWRYQFGVPTKRRFVSSHYHILFCVKDRRRYKFNMVEHYPEDVWIINREFWTGWRTPTKLPKALIKKIILHSSDEGDLILDPFCGSGTVPVVAKALRRHYIAFEIVPEYVELAKERVRQEAGVLF